MLTSWVPLHPGPCHPLKGNHDVIRAGAGARDVHGRRARPDWGRSGADVVRCAQRPSTMIGEVPRRRGVLDDFEAVAIKGELVTDRAAVVDGHHVRPIGPSVDARPRCGETAQHRRFGGEVVQLAWHCPDAGTVSDRRHQYASRPTAQQLPLGHLDAVHGSLDSSQDSRVVVRRTRQRGQLTA
jgi:hypothetical protein